MNLLVPFLVLAFASYRVADLLADPAQVGPLRIVETLQRWLGAHVDYVAGKAPKWLHVTPGTVADLVTCNRCLSVVVPAVLLVLYIVARPLVEVLAVSGLVRFLFAIQDLKTDGS